MLTSKVAQGSGVRFFPIRRCAPQGFGSEKTLLRMTEQSCVFVSFRKFLLRNPGSTRFGFAAALRSQHRAVLRKSTASIDARRPRRPKGSGVAHYQRCNYWLQRAFKVGFINRAVL